MAEDDEGTGGDEGHDAGEQQINLPDLALAPEGSITLDAEYVAWLESQPVPSNVSGIDESASHGDAAPNV